MLPKFGKLVYEQNGFAMSNEMMLRGTPKLGSSELRAAILYTSLAMRVFVILPAAGIGTRMSEQQRGYSKAVSIN